MVEADDIWDALSSITHEVIISRAHELGSLVHYTSFTVLKSIIETQTLWFSPISNMNDFDELEKGKDLLIQYSSNGECLFSLISEIIKYVPELEAGFLNGFENIRSHDFYQTFVSCWSAYPENSEEIDNLAMWRGYASEGNGVAISVDPRAIGVGTQIYSEIIVVPIEYETEREFCDRALSQFNKFLVKMQAFDRSELLHHQQYVIQAFLNLCFFLAVSHKHPGFAQEREWRFVWRRHLDGENNFKRYVEAKLHSRGLFEYFCLPLKDDENLTAGTLKLQNLLKRITIGPCEDLVLKTQAIQTLLIRNGFEENSIQIDYSKIPFRSY